MTRARALLAVAPLAAGLVLSACGGPASGATAGDGPSIVTALYPLAFVAERVGGADITLTNLAKPGVEPHDLELAPREVGTIASAELIIYLDGFAPAVDEAVEQNAADRGLDVGDTITLLPATDDADPDEGTFDPHFWLDPTRLATVATNVADRLSQIDPTHATAYAERAAALLDDLDALDGEFQSGLATCDVRTIVTAHAAFAYLAKRYGLEQLSVAGLDPDAEPSGARIADVQEAINERGITTVYFEPLTSPDVVDAIANDLGLRTAELDPIESVDLDGGEDYLAVMARNLVTLQAGQGCA